MKTQRAAIADLTGRAVWIVCADARRPSRQRPAVGERCFAGLARSRLARCIGCRTRGGGVAGLAGVGAAAAVASTAAGIGGQIAKSGAISGGQSQATGALQQGIQTATNPRLQSVGHDQALTANTQESGLLGLNGQPATDAAISAFQNTPGYRISISSRGFVRRTPAQRPWGMLRSGAAIKAEQTFGTGPWPTIRSTTTGPDHLQQLFQQRPDGGGQQHCLGSDRGAATQIANTDASAAAAGAVRHLRQPGERGWQPGSTSYGE